MMTLNPTAYELKFTILASEGLHRVDVLRANQADEDLMRGRAFPSRAQAIAHAVSVVRALRRAGRLCPLTY